MQAPTLSIGLLQIAEIEGEIAKGTVTSTVASNGLAIPGGLGSGAMPTLAMGSKAAAAKGALGGVFAGPGLGLGFSIGTLGSITLAGAVIALAVGMHNYYCKKT